MPGARRWPRRCSREREGRGLAGALIRAGEAAEWTIGERGWQARIGEIELAVPKLRQGTISPELSRRGEGGASRHWSLACRRPTSTASRPARSIAWSRRCRSRPLEGRYPYLWLDAKIEKVRDGGRSQPKALVVALWHPRVGVCVRCSRSMSARPRRKRSGGHSCTVWSSVAPAASSWLSPMRTRA